MNTSHRDRLILLLTIALHIVLFASWTLHKRRTDKPAGRRMEIIWLHPAAPHRPEPVAKAAAPGRIARAMVPPPAPQQPAAPAIEATPQPAATPAPRADDPFAQPPSAALDVVSQAKLDIGKIDRELRKSAPAAGLALQADSIQAKLEHAFNAAHDAVKPKWYEGAKITELPSNDPHKKIFRIATALGDYCIYLNEEGKKSYANCPR